MLSVSALMAALCLIGCGSDPTQEDVCGACTDATIKASCEAG